MVIYIVYRLVKERNRLMEEKRFRKNLEILDWYDALVFALTALVLVFAFCVRVVVVSGHSMEPTLSDGDRLLIQSTFYTPQHGDVVVVDGYINYGKPLVKRVIAKGGDTVDIDSKNGIVYVNGQALEEPYVAEPTYTIGNIGFPLTVPEGQLFVMGDNRQHSTDSRFTSVGLIDERDILGKVLWRIFPLDSLEKIQ